MHPFRGKPTRTPMLCFPLTYQRLSALFQFYLELVFKAFTFALGIAGGVSAFVLGKDVSDERLAAFGLLLPALLCGGMGAPFVQAVPSSKELKGALQKLKLELELTLAPHASNLTAALRYLGYLLIACGFILLGLFGYIAWGPQHGEHRGIRQEVPK
jgi:hypothetical protein